MKKLLITLLLVAGLTSAVSAAQLTKVVNPNSITNLLVGGGKVSQFILTSTSATNNILSFLDAPTNTSVFVLSAYSNLVTQTASFTNIYTNYFGVLTTNTFSGIQEVTNSIAQSTNSYNGILTAQVTANTTLTIGNAITFPAGSVYYFYQGVTVTNSGAGPATVTLTY